MKAAGTAAVTSLVGARPAFSSSPQRRERPNILLIVVDDMRPELGCYGSAIVQSPNIDRLAREGVVFTRAFTPQAICNPARNAILTGKRPDTLRIWDNNVHFRNLHPRTVTLPQLFKNRGYRSIGLGKIFHGTLPDPPSWSRPKFTIPPVFQYMSRETRDRQGKRQEAARKQGMSQAWIDAYLRGPATEATDAPDSLYWDGVLAEVAILTLEDMAERGPFFLAVGFAKPHLPFIAPRRYWDLYDRDTLPLAENNFLPRGAPRFAINGLTELACHEDFVQIPNPTEGQLGEDQARLLKHGYYACLSFVDAQIGRILDALSFLGLRERTIVVLAGDHGWKLGEHGSWGKLTNYETDTRTPLIVSAPGRFRTGLRSDALVELVDIYPTLAELAGLNPPPDLEGTSVRPLLEDPGRPWKTAAFSQFARGFTYRFMGRAMRTERYRYIEWRDRFDGGLVAVELYDHENDPLENENIATDPECADLLRELGDRLRRGWRGALPESAPGE
jgi:arylsulfatase A-like enzyme